MTDLKDISFMGHMIVSFNTAVLTPLRGSQFNEPTAGFIFMLSTGQVRVVKFTRDLFGTFYEEMKRTLAKFPDADQRDNLDALLKNKQFIEENFESISSHPIVIHIQSKPAVPDEIRSAFPHQYVKFVHINAYPEVFKFDFTFADESTDRFSMASSVAVFLMEAMEVAWSKL